MTAHVKFLKKHYAAGTFLVSGRKIPRDGGIILAVGKSKQEIETLIKEDPFHQHGLAGTFASSSSAPASVPATCPSASEGAEACQGQSGVEREQLQHVAVRVREPEQVERTLDDHPVVEQLNVERFEPRELGVCTLHADVRHDVAAARDRLR